MRTTAPSFRLGLAWTLPTNVAAVLAGMVTGLLLARFLGPDGRGALAAVQTWPGLFQGVGALGLTTAAAYFSGCEPRRAGRLLTTCLIALSVWAVPVLLIAHWLMPTLLDAQSAEIVWYARLYLLIIPIQFLIAAPFNVFQGLGEFRLWSLLRLQGPLAWLLVIGLAWWLGAATWQFIAVVYLGAMACVAAVFLWAAATRIRPPRGPDFSWLPDMLRYGLPSSLAIVPQQLNLRLDQLLMAALLPAHILGLYVVAVAWSGALSAFHVSVSQVIFPQLAGIHDREEQRALLERTLRLSVLGACGMVAVLLPATPIGLPLLFGAAFSPAIPAASLLVLAAGFNGVNQVAGEVLRGIGLPKRPMVAETIGVAFTVILLALLLQKYQLMGAAVASVTGYAATATASVLLVAHGSRTRVGMLVMPRREDVAALWEQAALLRPWLASRR